jgi:hypothetical protein
MTTGLRKFLAPRPEPDRGAKPGEWCEMCSEPLSAEHSHVANIESRSILCTCRGCYLLFTHPGAGGGKHRAVPERFRYAPSFPTGQIIWDATGIPVGMAFLFHSSTAGPSAFYPSPAGATESLLPLRAWEQTLRDNPAFADLETDVEALLVKQNTDGFEGFLVPIDSCYQLVGVVRLHWKGFDGGSEAWQHIDAFFDSLRWRSRRIEVDDG